MAATYTYVLTVISVHNVKHLYSLLLLIACGEEERLLYERQPVNQTNPYT